MLSNHAMGFYNELINNTPDQRGKDFLEKIKKAVEENMETTRCFLVPVISFEEEILNEVIEQDCGWFWSLVEILSDGVLDMEPYLYQNRDLTKSLMISVN